MGFKEWLTKPRLSDENWRHQMAFVGKGVVIVIGALAILLMGTDFFDRRATILSASGMPVGDTQWSGRPVELSKAIKENWCSVNGRYSVENIGDLSFRVDHVLVEVHRLDNRVQPAVVGKVAYPATIKALNNSLKSHQAYAAASIAVGENFGPGNIMEASFVLEFEIPANLKDGEEFVVTAKAAGALPDTQGKLLNMLSKFSRGPTDFTKFGENDLRISTATFPVYSGGCTDEFGFENQGAGDLIVKTIGWPDP